MSLTQSTELSIRVIDLRSPAPQNYIPAPGERVKCWCGCGSRATVESVDINDGTAWVSWESGSVEQGRKQELLIYLFPVSVVEQIGHIKAD